MPRDVHLNGDTEGKRQKMCNLHLQFRPFHKFSINTVAGNIVPNIHVPSECIRMIRSLREKGMIFKRDFLKVMSHRFIIFPGL